MNNEQQEHVDSFIAWFIADAQETYRRTTGKDAIDDPDFLYMLTNLAYGLKTAFVKYFDWANTVGGTGGSLELLIRGEPSDD